MAKLSVLPQADQNTANAAYMERFQRRVEATPPGMCPIALQLSLLQAAQIQTCGKCVPCRDGIPELARLLEQVLTCAADESVLQTIRLLATIVRDTSDCAIGWEAANAVLEGLETFAQ